MKQSLLFGLLFVFLSLPVYAEAGKLEKSALRLKFAGLGGIYNSDWERRNQDFNLVYARSLESNWQDQNKATGIRLGADYYAALGNPLFTHLLFGLNVADLKGSFPSSRIGTSQIETLNYKGNQQQISVTFGTVISVLPDFRVITKFVHRSIRQDLQTDTLYLFYDSVDAAITRGKEKISNRDSAGFLGLGLEYDITPNLTIYFDALLFHNVFFTSSGRYKYTKEAEGYLISNASAGISNRFDDSSGTYKISGNRFSLGTSLKLSESLRFFVSFERDVIESQISAPFGTNLVLVSIIGRSGALVSSDTARKTLTEYVMYSQKQRYEASTIQIGLSKDISF
ncbi:hypothetical protein LPTSP4_24840 [Leptospira ryugenii]|uniref:Uncharacterized protein n=1 Tax=Leptospira ryugenii TaxID=1917863 RepID=A0A2P2E224_9LEPT|nr:hypothetical protein [Leptospira ryugenii]GBF50953.1 hypothetical protein LPTSP4_24840 [Leptospira ryugenii]